MSHFTTVETRFHDPDIVGRLCAARGWTMERVAEYKNRYFSLTGESVKNCMVLRDANGREKLVIDADGKLHVDKMYMGNAHKLFASDYATEYLRRKASAEGAVFRDLGVDSQGDRVLEICYV